MRRTRSLLLIIFLAFACQQLYAHVGSPGVIYQGKAGPYNVMVNVKPPDVIPGTATVSVYINDPRVSHIYIQPVYWYAGDKGSPKEDEALPVQGMPGQYQGSVWLMQSGVASMKIMIDGAQGKGSVIVPVMALSTAMRTMPAGLGWQLAGLGLLLVVLMVTIISSSVTDGLLSPGAPVDTLRAKKYRVMAITTVLLILLLYGGSAWWNSWRNNYRRFMYKAPLVHTAISVHGAQLVLNLNIDSAWLRKNDESMDYIIPDHGKLMHLFLVKENTDDVFAHLHPLRTDSDNYKSALPDLPAGRYRVFGDIVRWNGFAETVSDTLTIPAKPVMRFASNNSQTLYSDPDDTYMISNSVNDNKSAFTGKVVLICGRPGTSMKLSDGSTAYWQHAENTTFEANKIYPLTFAINGPDGKPARLQPYMGMAGHAVVMKYDGSVYVHLHPVGNYSMASQEIILNRIGNKKTPKLPDGNVFRDSIDALVTKVRAMNEDQRNAYLNADMRSMAMPGMQGDQGMVTFPYAFPSPGNYRIWVQTKRNGKILNSAFDAVVE